MFDDADRVKRDLNKAYYHAFLLYADEDTECAREIMQKLQTKYKLRLCYKSMIPNLPNLKEDEAMKTLISERCNKLLVIFSPDFLRCPTNQSLLNYAQSLSVEKQERKIVPCLYKSKRINMPYQLQDMFCVDYTRSRYEDFWKLLSHSIQAPNSTQIPNSIQVPNSIQASNSIQAITSNTIYIPECDMLYMKKLKIKTLPDKRSVMIQTAQKTDEETDEEGHLRQIENHVRDTQIYLNNENEKNERLLRENQKDLVELMALNWNRSNTETFLRMVSLDNISLSSLSSLSSSSSLNSLSRLNNDICKNKKNI